MSDEKDTFAVIKDGSIHPLHMIDHQQLFSKLH